MKRDFTKSLTNVTLNVIVRLRVITCRPLAIYAISQPFLMPRKPYRNQSYNVVQNDKLVSFYFMFNVSLVSTLLPSFPFLIPILLFIQILID